MLAVTTYPQQFVAGVRARIDADLAAYDALDSPGTEFEHRFFNNMVLVLDHSFMHRARNLEGKDGNPINEARVITESVIDHAGVMTPIKAIKFKPADSLLKIELGEQVAVTRAGFEALANGFLTEIEVRYKP